MKTAFSYPTRLVRRSSTLARRAYAALAMASDVSTRRRELVVSLLAGGMSVVAAAAFVTSLVHHIVARTLFSDAAPLLATVLFLIISTSIWYAARIGRSVGASRALVGLLVLTCLGLVLAYGFALPQVELVIVMTIVTAGCILSSRAGIWCLLGLGVYVLAAAYGQAQGWLRPDTSWQHGTFGLNDAVGFIITFGIVGLVAWISNHELERALQRARASELALQKERDNLEQTVAQRTRQLEQSQLAQVLQLQRFAEFGRISAGLLHEVANPLTAASLSLQQAAEEPDDRLVQQALHSIGQIDRYVEAARKQLQSGGERSNFSIQQELTRVTAMLASKARAADVRLDVHAASTYRLYGDAVKFNQLAANLIANAIEAYRPEHDHERRRVAVSVERRDNTIVLTCTDWGHGLKPAQQKRIFDPFYSTKTEAGRGLGVGLSLVRQYVEHDFGGSITVSSTWSAGTRFEVVLVSQPMLPQPVTEYA